MDSRNRPRGARTVAALTLLLGVVPLLLLTWAWVPWDAAPADLPPVDARTLLEPGQIEQAEEHAARSRLLSWSSLAMSLALLVAIAAWGRPRVWIARLRGPWWWRVLVATAAVLVLVRVLTLPWALALHAHRRAAGLSTQDRPEFLGDLVRSEAVSVLVTAFVVLVLVGTARRWRRAWPLVAGAVLGSAVVIGSFAYPVVVEPLFNDFEPLADGLVREEVVALAEEMDTPLDDVLVADASRRTTTYNAWVSGLGPTRRVVLYDTLVEEVPLAQVRGVVAHELAHARHADVVVGTAIGAAGVLAATGLLGLLVPPRSGRSWLAQATAVPVLVALLAVGTQLVAPVSNGISRALETRADVEAVRATGDAETFVGLQRSFAVAARSDPTPPALSHWWWGSHPTLGVRVALARWAVEE